MGQPMGGASGARHYIQGLAQDWWTARAQGLSRLELQKQGELRGALAIMKRFAYAAAEKLECEVREVLAGERDAQTWRKPTAGTWRGQGK